MCSCGKFGGVCEEHAAETADQMMAWRKLALHALHDLRLLGIPIEQMVDVGMSPEVLAEVDAYSRGMESFG